MQGWRRNWLIRAEIGPSSNLLQYEDCFAVIRPAAPRSVAAQPVERWSPPTIRPNVEWPFPWRIPAELQTSSAAKASPPKMAVQSSTNGASDLAALITAAVKETLKPLETRFDSLSARVDNLEMKDCTSDEEMAGEATAASGRTTPRGADKRKNGDRAGPSPLKKEKKNGT